MDNTWQVITNRMNELQPMHKRMDESRDLAYITPYQLTDPENPELAISGAINVTGNWAAVGAHAIIQDLLKAQWQTVVEGLTDRQAHEIEEFIDYNVEQGDEYLLEEYGLPGLYHWLCNHVCVRGPIGAEWYSWVENKEYKIHCQPLDMRYVAYHPAMKWVAPILYMTRDEVTDAYPGYKGKSKVDIEVRDYWDDEKEEVWIESQLIETKPNVFGKPPFVIVFPPSGFMLRDKQYIKHEAEDIFFLIRELNKENNRTLTIEQSLIYNVLRPGYERPTENPDASPAEPIPQSGEVIKVKKGEEARPVPTGDFNRATLTAKQDIQRMLSDGLPIAPRSYTSPPSGSELVAEMEALSRLQHSRIIALQLFKQRLARLMIEQYTMLSKNHPGLEIGRMGKRKGFSATVLRDPKSYSISYQGMTKNKRQELANLAMFAAARAAKLPTEYCLENILMVEDVDGVMRMMALQDAKEADPAINLLEMGVKYAEEAENLEVGADRDFKNFESQSFISTGIRIIKQRRQPAQLPEKAQVPQIEQPRGGGNLLPALIGGEANLPGQPKAPEEAV